MYFKNDDASMTLQINGYEFPHLHGDLDRDEINWLVLRCTYAEDDLLIKETNSCLLTYELQEMNAGLKVMRAGIKPQYRSDFQEPYFSLSAAAETEDTYWISVSFALLSTMEDVDMAEVETVISRAELDELIGELDKLCSRYPERVPGLS